MKIKEKIQELFNQYKKILIIYPITNIGILLCTLILTILADELDGPILKLFQFLVFFTIGSLVTEVVFKEKKRLLYAFFAIISFILVLFINSHSLLVCEIAERITIVYVVISVIIVFYKLYKNSRVSLGHYLISSISNILKTSIVYYILAIGLVLISLAFENLILNGNDFDLIYRIEILLFGAFYLPNILEDFTNVDQKTKEFMKIIVHYTLFFLIVVAFIVIYFYLFKIIITRSFPSNEIFRIIGILFFFYLPTWIMNNYYQDDLIFRINKKLPYLFIPFVLLQVYSLGIRIINHGITIIRYFGIMLLIVEIVHIIMYIMKKEDDYLFYLIGIITIISLVCPFINAYEVSMNSQIKIIDNLLIKKTLTNQEKEKLYSSYDYVSSFAIGQEKLNKYSNEQKKLVESYRGYHYYNENYFSEGQNIEEIDVKGFNNLYNLSYVLDNKINILDAKILLKNKNISVDITKIIMEYFENSANIHQYFSNHNEFMIDNKKVIISSIAMEYNDNNIFSLIVYAFVLE